MKLLTVGRVREHGDGGALQIIILSFKQFLIFISLTETVTTEGKERGEKEGEGEREKRREKEEQWERDDNYYKAKDAQYSECLRRSRRVSFSLSLFEAGRCDFERRCGGSFATTSGIHKVREDFCLLEKEFKSLSFVLFLKTYINEQYLKGVHYLEKVPSLLLKNICRIAGREPVHICKRRKERNNFILSHQFLSIVGR